MKMEFVTTWTKDKLRLPGFHYEPENKDLAIVFIHGMSGLFIENYFGKVLGENLSSQGIGFIFGHNRGYSHINDIRTSSKKKSGLSTVRVGVMYEKFEDSEPDIEAWLNKARELGYKRLILAGHSLGCNKSLYYLHRNKAENIVGVILLSPPDMVGLMKVEGEDKYQEILKEAKENIKNGDERKMLREMIWDWYYLSSQTFISLFSEGGASDNLPVMRNPKEFPELASVNVPLLLVMGEKDDIPIRGLKEDLELIVSKATNCPDISSKMIPGAGHTYSEKEEELSRAVASWLEKRF